MYVVFVLKWWEERGMDVGLSVLFTKKGDFSI